MRFSLKVETALQTAMSALDIVIIVIITMH